MRDAELLVRYFALQNFLPSYKGNLKDFLDSTCAQLNSTWDSVQSEIQVQLEQFEEAANLTFEIFGDKTF
jgi:hypothetical protein